MSGRLPRALLLALVAAGAGRAAAEAPPPVDLDLPPDFDDESEQKSDFWEKALEPSKQKYEELIAKAVELVKQSDKASRDLATTYLRDAVKLAPDRPLAHMWLGRVEGQNGNHAACAQEIARALDADPKFIPPSNPYLEGDVAGAEWAGRYELALCRAQSADYEGAIDGLRRILAGGGAAEAAAGYVHWHLGESYMALGRLDEALASLQQAYRLLPYAANISFALAVAYDRDEEPTQSRDALSRALEREPRVSTSSLLSSSRIWIPADDQHYYLGLAYLGAGEAPRALYHLRRYISTTGEGMWTARARAHLETAQAGAVAGKDLAIRGSATLDDGKAAAAIGKLDGDLQACVARLPDLLLSVALTRVVPGADQKGDSTPRPAGVRVLVLEQNNLKSDALKAATTCAETAAAKIALPKPTGPAGAYVTATFSLIAR
jgi:tetratricopeptide (TPR) repeat protein